MKKGFKVLGILAAIPFIAFIVINAGISGFFDYESTPWVRRGEFDFKIEYKVYDEIYEYKGTMVCKFEGFRIGGGNRRRQWSKSYKNLHGDIVEENILYELDNHKIVLVLYKEEYFMSDPDETYSDEELYFVSVIEIDTGYSLYNCEEEDEIFQECGFEVISWECDPPIENKYW